MQEKEPKKVKEKVEDKEDKSAEKAAGEDTFTLDVLKEHSMEIFGQPHYVIAGALHGEQPKESYTKSEIQTKINKFLKEEMK